MPKVKKNNKTKKSLKRVPASLATNRGNCSKVSKKEPKILSPKVMVTEPSDTEINKNSRNVQCSSSEAASSPASESPSPPPGPTQTVRNNIGSDSDTDESDGEDILMPIVVPRVFWSTFRTPVDQEEDSDEEETAAIPAYIADPGSEADEYYFNWRPFPDVPIPPQSRRETFSQTNVGPTTPLVDPYDLFVAIWDREIMEHIASETNRYAQELAARMFEENTLGPNSRISKWQDTTVDELYVFFGIILAMGIVIKHRTEEYWTTNADVFYTPGFSAHMAFNRFCILSQCLHFNNNEDMCALEPESSEARLFKIQPLLSHLNLKFSSLYVPSQNIVVDESLLMWKGWKDKSQLMSNNTPIKKMKTFELCESITGYLWRFEVHTGKRSQRSLDPLDKFDQSTVLSLTKGLEHKGYTVWMDSYYNSPSLARRLKSLGFDCVGTLRTDRPNVPQALHRLTELNMRKGQICGYTSGDVDVMVWRDTHRIAMISTYHGNGVSQIRESTKPCLINDYNKIMLGMDKKDRMLATYPIEQKRTKVWYKKLFRRLLNISAHNAYIIHRHSSNRTHRNFRISLVRSLLSKHGSASPIVSSSVLSPRPVDVTHRLCLLPIRTSQRMRRTCSVCKKLTTTECVGCDKTVCLEPCFLTLHLK